MYHRNVKTTLDLPDAVVENARREAAQRQTTLEQLVVTGLQLVMMQSPPIASTAQDAIARLEKGFSLDGKPLSRAEIHERKPLH